MATHSSTLAWKIPWTEEPGGRKELDTTEQLHFHFHFHFFMGIGMETCNVLFPFGALCFWILSLAWLLYRYILHVFLMGTWT